MQTGRRDGMQTLDQCLADQVERGRITRDEARRHAVNKAGF
jgi:Tfp pilus assembly pilus retraction ATPase PilT